MVILYHQQSCPQCKAVELLLAKNKISYTSNMDIKDMMDKGICHTPVLEVDGERFVGKQIFQWANSHTQI